jgi:hypothetical protein
MPEFCPRCFWIKRNVPSGVPFQIFPGIFSSIDSYTKHVVHGWFDRHNSAPAWLADLGPIEGYIDPPHHSKFRFLHTETKILLTGSPDGVFVLPDGSYMIVDYKTAKFSGTQDELFPTYQTQLNAYAVIAEACGLKPVSKLALIYFEPITDKKVASKNDIIREDGFRMGFSARILPVRLDPMIIEPLLAKTREILDLPSPPNGRTGCKDCEKVDELARILGK